MKIGVHKVAMASPSDVSELARKIDNKEIDPATIVALIGKTEGNGGANDFTRGFATLSFQLLLAPLLGLTPDEVGSRMAMVEAVAAAVRDCMAQTGITDSQAVHYVQVKGPLLTPARISDARARGAKLATEDPNGSKVFARGAMALGVALALGEVAATDL